MSDSYVQVRPDSTGKKVDAEIVSIGADTVVRQRIVLTGAGAAEIARIVNTDPTGTEYALLVRTIEIQTPVINHTTEATIAAGGTATLYSTAINTNKTGKLMGLVISSSVPLKIQLQTVTNDIASGNLVVRFIKSEGGWDWKTPEKNFIKVIRATASGFHGFRVIITNHDTSDAADVYATFFFDEG